MKLLHVITALNVGGAETMLAKLVERPLVGRYPLEQEVLSLVTPGPMADRLRTAGIPLHSLGMREGVPSPVSLTRLIRIARSIRPDLIVGWMHHGQLAASLASLCLRSRPPVIWNVRHSLSDIRHEKALTRVVLRLCASASASPAAIIYNSRNAREQYERFGYRGERSHVLANGFDCSRYCPRPDARDALLDTFGIRGQPVIVGMVARAHPMKDPETLVEAVRRARQCGIDVHLLIAGKGMDDPRLGLSAAAGAGLPPERVTLVGQRGDIADWLPGLDILALPSAWGEAFPNILGEAMLSGVPCVATDVGDSGWILGGTGLVVPPRDPEAMAGALVTLANLGATGRRALGLKGRARVIEHFSIAEIAGRYAKLYDDVLDARVKPVEPAHVADKGALA